MSGWRRAGIGLGIAVALYAGLLLASRTGFVRGRLERAASAQAGYDVRVGGAWLDAALGAHAADVRVAAATAEVREPFLTAAAVDVRGLLPALLGAGTASIAIASPRFRVAAWEPPRRAAGEAGDSALALPAWIGRVDVWDGAVLGGTSEQGFELGPIDVSASAVEASTDLRLAGGSELPGGAGRIAWSAEIAPGGARIAARARLEVASAGRLAEALAVALPAALDAAQTTVDWTAEGAAGGPLRVRAQGRTTLAAAGPPLAITGEASVDTATGRVSFDVDVAPEASDAGPIAIGAAELRVDAASLGGDLDLAAGATRAELALSGVGWKGAEGGLLAERVAVAGEVAVAPSSPDGDSALRLDLRSERGELLLGGRTYVDLAAAPLSLAGTVTAVPRGVVVRDGRVELGGIGRAAVSFTVVQADEAADEAGDPTPPAAPDDSAPGVAAPALLTLSAQVDLPDVAGAFALAVRDPWQEVFPTLAQTTLHGPVRASLEAVRDAAGALTAVGRVEWRHGSLAAAEPAVRIADVSLDLPLLVGAVRARPETGSATLAGVEIGGVAVGPIALALRASADRLALAEPARIPALDGAVVVNELVAADLSSPARSLRFGLRGSALRLAPLATAAGLPPFGGTLTVDLPRARLAGGALETEGEVALDVFGGTVRLQHLRASEIGSGVATFALDATFADISLGALTEVLDIGRISGVAQGGVEGLEVQAGTPVRFRAWLETVERSGVPQRISVDAIRSLSILGGSGGDPFSSGVLGFFDEYGYAKIGFRCTLEGDRLTLEGIEQRDGKEMLVLGSFLPPRVDVVSHTRTIAFSEMVRRLRRALESEGPRIE